MKKLYIVANWKSNLTSVEAREWLVKIANSKLQIANSNNKEIIVCPSSTLLKDIKSGIKNYELGFKVGAQNVSPFDEGAYTGEVSAKLIKEFAEFVIIGHSERRKNFGETDDIVNQKIQQSLKHNLTPILCVSDLKQIHNSKSIIHNANCIIAYEPLFAIGSGTADTPENADQMAKSIKNILGEIPVLYGGSVTSSNISEFSKMPNIDGALVGKASLDPLEFLGIIKNA